MISLRCILACLSTVVLAGCTSQWDEQRVNANPGGRGITIYDDVRDGPNAVSTITQLPKRNAKGALPPFGAQGHLAAYEYRDGYTLGAGDKVAVKVAGEDDLTGEYVIDPSGNISMPYVSSLQVAGKTPREIEKAIVARLKNGYLRDPKVAVQITELRPFFIMGEVQSAGGFAYQPGMTVQNAIAIAGGFSPRADKNEAMITRRNSKGTRTFKVPVSTQVYPGDIIYVKERWF